MNKSTLLEDLSTAVMHWNARKPLRWRARRNVEDLIRLLGRCPGQQPLEELKLDAIDCCFRLAQERKPPPYLRKVWLQEIWSWQQLLAVGAGENSYPDLPPPNPHAGKSPMEMQWRRVLLLPPGL